MKKILIIYASAGDGHKKAAEAIYDAFLELKDPDIKAVPIDSLNYTTHFFKDSYKMGYLIMIKYLPAIWGFFYYILDNKFFYALARPFRRMLNAFSARGLIDFLKKEKFDIAISTHFLGTEVISYLNRKGKLYLPLINVITDYKPHLFWQAKGIARYAVAQEITKEALIKRGVDKNIITVCGIPIRRGFSIAFSREAARKQMGLYADKFTVFLMGGGFGVGPIKNTLLNLQRLDFNCQIIVVCGHNKGLVKELNSLNGKFKKPTSILGFTKDIDKIMSASNIMISKLGGITVSETLAKGIPVLCINPIPGQEARNGKFLADNGIGFKTNNAAEVNEFIQNFFRSSHMQEEISSKIHKLSKPHAADDIVKLAIEMLK